MKTRQHNGFGLAQGHQRNLTALGGFISIIFEILKILDCLDVLAVRHGFFALSLNPQLQFAAA